MNQSSFLFMLLFIFKCRKQSNSTLKSKAHMWLTKYDSQAILEIANAFFKPPAEEVPNVEQVASVAVPTPAINSLSAALESSERRRSDRSRKTTWKTCPWRGVSHVSPGGRFSWIASDRRHRRTSSRQYACACAATVRRCVRNDGYNPRRDTEMAARRCECEYEPSGVTTWSSSCHSPDTRTRKRGAVSPPHLYLLWS